MEIQKDVSIAGPDSEKCEMVTPILTYVDMETLQGSWFAASAKPEQRVMPQEAAVFTSIIGANGHTPQTLETSQTSWQATKTSWQSALNLDRVPHQPLLPHG